MDFSQLNLFFDNMQDTLFSLETTIASETARWLAIFTLIAALADCFFGLRLFRFKCGAVGFLLFSITAGILTWSWSNHWTWVICAALLAGILGAILSYRLFHLGIFLCCFLAAFFLADPLLGPAIGFWPSLIVSVVLGLLLGILGLKSTKHVLICTSVFSGASSSVSAVGSIAGELSQTLGWILWGLLLGLGLLLQYYQNRRG